MASQAWYAGWDAAFESERCQGSSQPWPEQEPDWERGWTSARRKQLRWGSKGNYVAPTLHQRLRQLRLGGY